MITLNKIKLIKFTYIYIQQTISLFILVLKNKTIKNIVNFFYYKLHCLNTSLYMPSIKKLIKQLGYLGWRLNICS